LNQLRHVRFLKSAEGIAQHMDRHRDIMAPKFTKVLETFKEHLGSTGIAEWTEPKGGYFITLDVLEGTAKQVVKLAKEAGVELTPAGATHPGGNDPADRTIRIAPSFPPANEVELAAEGVVIAVLLAATEKLLQNAK
jgi:DNA-binding transcriptional MocR family regulator